MGDKTVIGTINVPREVTVEDVGYILCGCFEGGSNYWIETVNVDDFKGESHASDVPGAGGVIEIQTEPLSGKMLSFGVGVGMVCEYTDKSKWLVTKDHMIRGLNQYYMEWKRALPIEDMDAGDYDVVLQYAIFGEQVYA